MEKLIFEFENTSYILKKSETINGELLGLFFSIDFPINPNFYIDWLDDFEQTETGGNLTFLEKENNKIFILDQYAEDIYENAFELKKTIFKRLLQNWNLLIKQRPKSIIIAIDGDYIKLEGKK